MIFANVDVCPICGGSLKYYDEVMRLIKGKDGRKQTTRIKRYKCKSCCHVHRRLPDYIFPFKQYDANIIIGVVENLITSETLGFEDYPCGLTMKRWRTQNLQGLL